MAFFLPTNGEEPHQVVRTIPTGTWPGGKIPPTTPQTQPVHLSPEQPIANARSLSTQQAVGGPLAPWQPGAPASSSGPMPSGWASTLPGNVVNQYVIPARRPSFEPPPTTKSSSA